MHKRQKNIIEIRKERTLTDYNIASGIRGYRGRAVKDDPHERPQT